MMPLDIESWKNSSFVVIEPSPEQAFGRSVVYGPVASRSLGRYLGINFGTDPNLRDLKCRLCQYDWLTEDGAGEITQDTRQLLEEVRKAFQRCKENKVFPERILIAGNGEPTLRADFPELIEGVVKIKSEFFPQAKTGIISGAAQVHRAQIRETLEMLDECYMKLTAGHSRFHNEMNPPQKDFDFEKAVNGLMQMRHIVIKSLFVRGHFDNTRPDELDHWMESMGFIQPRMIWVEALDSDAGESGLQRVSVERLQEIADSCHSMTGVRTVVIQN